MNEIEAYNMRNVPSMHIFSHFIVVIRFCIIFFHFEMDKYTSVRQMARNNLTSFLQLVCMSEINYQEKKVLFIYIYITINDQL